jgi:hypothetical protein
MLDNIFNAINKITNPQTMQLPYPEEAPDFYKMITGEELLQKFFAKYFIPEVYWNFWRRVNIKVDNTLKFPAGMVSETKTLLLKPEYANPGILAHEFSHLSYSELNPDKKAAFVMEYNSALQTDNLLRFLYVQKPYMKTNNIEAHAEIFRYLGNKMPPQLNKYYPKLFLPPQYQSAQV